MNSPPEIMAHWFTKKALGALTLGAPKNHREKDPKIFKRDTQKYIKR